MEELKLNRDFSHNQLTAVFITQCAQINSTCLAMGY